MYYRQGAVRARRRGARTKPVMQVISLSMITIMILLLLLLLVLLLLLLLLMIIMILIMSMIMIIVIMMIIGARGRERLWRDRRDQVPPRLSIFQNLDIEKQQPKLD